jgi:peptidoglycan/xylan/chitin deacetylase (PgdA/CDA1 family)
MSKADKIKKIVYKISYYIGLTNLAFWLNSKKQIIITYHNVIEDEFFDHSLHLGVSNKKSEFLKQLSAISSRFEVVTEVGVPGTCLLTFDDGYFNNFSVVFPVLNDYKINAIFFVPASMLTVNEALWTDKLMLWLSYVPYGRYPIADNLFITINSEASRHASWHELWSWLQENYSHKEKIIDQMDKIFPFKYLKIPKELYEVRFRTMSIPELTIMKNNGNKIGAHSAKHEILSKLLNINELEFDFKQCEKYLGDVYNTTVYSYPFGGANEVSEQVVSVCRQSMFTSALLNCLGNKSRFEIGRISLGSTTDFFTIHAKLSGLECFLKKLFKWVSLKWA